MQASVHFENSPLFFPNPKPTMGDKCGIKNDQKIEKFNVAVIVC